jgi:hypothetical protein
MYFKNTLHIFSSSTLNATAVYSLSLWIVHPYHCVFSASRDIGLSNSIFSAVTLLSSFISLFLSFLSLTLLLTFFGPFYKVLNFQNYFTTLMFHFIVILPLWLPSFFFLSMFVYFMLFYIIFPFSFNFYVPSILPTYVSHHQQQQH